MDEKPKILVIGGSVEERERLIDEIFEKMNVMQRTDLYFSIKSTDHLWRELVLKDLTSHT